MEPVVRPIAAAPDPSATADAALASAAGLGDRSAFEEIVRRFGRPVYRYARRMLANEADVADVVQETFVSAWRQLPGFRGDATLQTWLFTICQRRVADFYRTRGPVPIDDQPFAAQPSTDRATDPFAAASNAEFLAALEQALLELPQRQRAAWVLREIEQLSFPEIGTVLDLGADAVRGHFHRASRTLALRLERWR